MLTEMGPDVSRHRDFDDWRTGLVRCDYGYGHWVRLPNVDADDPEDRMERRLAALPESLADCMRHAAQYGVTWILLDRDEPAVPQLRQYEW